jgi:hypothetical protein
MHVIEFVINAHYSTLFAIRYTVLMKFLDSDTQRNGESGNQEGNMIEKDNG